MNDPVDPIPTTPSPTSREVRADARDVRADARDVRADVADSDLQDRGVRANVREDTVTEREGSVTGSIRLLKWLVVVLIVISAGNLARTFVVQESTDRVTDAAKRAELVSIEGRDISRETLTEFRAIVAAMADQPQIDTQVVIDAFLAIARMEVFLCGGPCPSLID